MDKYDHPIAGLMETAMENIKKMVEVNTVVGEAVETKNGTVIIPVTKITCGFAAGGSQFSAGPKPLSPASSVAESESLPFGGGSGGGISVQPIGFLVVKDQDVRFQVVDSNAIFDRLLDQVPGFIAQIKEVFSKKAHDQAGDDEASLHETVETIITTTTVNLEDK